MGLGSGSTTPCETDCDVGRAAKSLPAPRYKKTVGRKRRIVVDALGLILAVVVHSAGVQDQDGALFVLKALDRMRTRLCRLRVIFADAAYGWLLQTVLRPARVKGFVVLPKRWIVERTFAWLGRYRRHSKDYERNPASSEGGVLRSVSGWPRDPLQ